MIRHVVSLLAVGATALHGSAVLDTQHADIAVNFNASLLGSATNPWRITVRDEDARIEYGGRRAATSDENQVVLDAVEASRTELPDDERYAFLGPEGAFSYILPQTQEPGMLFLGTSSENKTAQAGWQGFGVATNLLARGFPSGTFQNNRVNLRLATFAGPGEFFLYSTNAFGDPTIFYNTANGLSLDDSRLMSPANHTHFNWAFTEPGEYVLGFQASATLSNNTVTQSEITEIHFNVIPEPSSAALLMLAAATLLRRPFRSRNLENSTHP
jgi:surface-anchored protein